MTTRDDTLRFAAENPTSLSPSRGDLAWKLLIVDDDEFVHKVTKLVLADYSFEGRELTLLSAYNAEEGRAILEEQPDIAVILLDVVMETSQAGLDLAAWIRKELNNSMVRIILRTGQPGEAPEQEVIFKYDINDYKEKAELTAQKLSTAVTTAIRSYRDLRTIEYNRMGLERIVEASPTIFKTQSLRTFTAGALIQLSSILNLDNDSIMVRASGLAAAKRDDDFEIVASTGNFEDAQGQPIRKVKDKKATASIAKALETKQSFFSDDAFVGYYRTCNGSENVIYLRGTSPVEKDNRNLVEIFSSNIAVAFDNIDLHKAVVDTQRELLYTVGEVVETRSSETAQHVRRVAEYSYILALKSGMSEEKADVLRMASPMHDVGKIGIPDSVLLKPGKLTDEEFELIKSHTTIGHDILKNAESEIMKVAAVTALQHHERWDGTGYPHGLKDKNIDIIGRITMLADVFDALGCKRVYKDAWLVSDILNFLEEQRAKMFDPQLVDLFMENLDEFLAIKERFPDQE